MTLINSAISLAGKSSFGIRVTGLHGLWRHHFLSAQLHGMVYNLSERCVELLDDVWREQELLDEFETATVARLDFFATQANAIVRKNGVVVDDRGWRWRDIQHIEILGDVFRREDVWHISYEQLKEIITPAIDVGTLAVERRIFVDGYVVRRFEGELKEYEIREPITFNEDFIAPLRLGWSLDKQGVLATRKGRILQKWSFVDERTIQVDPTDVQPREEFILKYKGVWDWLFYEGVEVWIRTSANGITWSAWSRVEFDQEVAKHRFYTLRLRFRENIRAGTIRVRSLVIKVL